MNTWTDEQLQGLFEYYNRRYWNGKLDGWMVRWSGDGRPPAAAVDSMRQRDDFEQTFGPDWPEKLARIGLVAGSDRIKHEISVDISKVSSVQDIQITLLHEMCHAASTGTHGTSWQKEMNRIIRAGAPAGLRADLAHHQKIHEEVGGEA